MFSAQLMDLALQILGSILGGMTIALGATWRIRRRLYQVELDLADLQARLLQRYKKEAARARWDEEGAMDAALEAVAPSRPKRWTKWPGSAGSSAGSHGEPSA